MPATASTSLDAILRRSGLTDEMLRSAGVRPPSPGAPASAIAHEPAGAPAAAKTAQPAPRQPRASLEPSQRRETSSTAAKPPVPANRKSPVQRVPRPAATLSGFLEDKRPKVRLRGDNRLLSDVASELGPHLTQVVYVYAGEVVEYGDGSLHPTSAQRFRTLAEKHVTFYRVRTASESTVQVGATLDESDARGILVSPQFLERLNPIRHLSTVQLPVLRAGDQIEILPKGYDEATATLTVPEVVYDDSMSMDEALGVLTDLFGEYGFVDARSLAVAVAALIGLFAQQILPPKTLRPIIIYLKNSEGAGATTCAACAIVPVLGYLPTGTMPADNEEMRKLLTATLCEGRTVLLLDNVKHIIGGDALESFTTTATWRDRRLGVNETVELENTVSVFATGNGASCTPDIRRRSLTCELHLSEERAEDRIYRRPLSVNVLCALRGRILAACWTLVREWDAAGRPAPSRSHSAFPEWAQVVGGIVQAAGYACPFDTPASSFALDEDGANMRLLAAGMTPEVAYTAGEIVSLCRRINAFDGLVGATDSDFGRSQRTSFGRLLSRYDHRQVGDSKFFITGAGHARRFRVLRLENIEPLTARSPLLETDAEANESTPRKGSYTEGAI